MLERIAHDAGVSPPPRLTREALQHLARYPFPGNVREMENLLHRAVALSGGETIGVADLGLPESEVVEPFVSEPEAFDAMARDETPARFPSAASAMPIEEPLPSDLAQYLDEVERDILVRALERHRFNRTAAGAGLGSRCARCATGWRGWA